VAQDLEAIGSYDWSMMPHLVVGCCETVGQQACNCVLNQHPEQLAPSLSCTLTASTAASTAVAAGWVEPVCNSHSVQTADHVRHVPARGLAPSCCCCCRT